MYEDDKQNKFGFLDNIKDKLGIGKREYDDYDDSLDYDESYPQDDIADDQTYPPQQGFGNRGKISTRDVNSYSRDRVSNANLVSYEDARAGAPKFDHHTSASGNTHSGSGFNRATGKREVKRASDYTRSVPTQLDPYGYEDSAPISSDAPYDIRSQGLNSLFSSTSTTQTSLDSSARPSAINTGTSAGSSMLNTTGATSNKSVPLYAPKRNIVVVSPTSYSDAVNLTTALKAKEIVVLNLCMAPDTLRTRILDFAFGVASAMNAYVELVQDGIYSIYFTNSITVSELDELRNQGKL